LAVGGLALLSLVLLTIYFRESAGGTLHGVEGAGAAVLRPFEVGAERIARPFTDAYGYVRGLVHAKSDLAKARAEVRRWRQEAIQNASARSDVSRLQALLNFRDGPAFPSDYRAVNARVIGRQPSAFEQEIVIAAGSGQGVPLHAPVVTDQGLVGEVTYMNGGAARVTLITDSESAVAARDFQTNAFGLVRHGESPTSLILDRVDKDEVVNRGDLIVTAGQRSSRFPDLYPRDIQIGVVTFVGQTDTETYKQIQLEPLVHFDSLNAVAALVTTKRVPQLP
jgi:rod shape-determining protein MreC